MEKSAYDKGYEQGYAEAMEVVRKTKIRPTCAQIYVVAQEIKKYSYVKNYWVLAERAITTWEKIKGGEK